MKKSYIKKFTCFVLIFMLMCTMHSFDVFAASGSITVDGNQGDWSGITEYSGNGGVVDKWKVAFSEDKSTLYFAYTGTTSSQWDYNFLGDNGAAALSYSNGTAGKNSVFKVVYGGVVKDAYYGDIAGAGAVVVNEANGNTAGPYCVEASIPTSFFANMDFTINFAGTAVKASDIPVLEPSSPVEPVEPIEPVEPENPVYEGITIDGSFNDWAAVKKSQAGCPNGQHKDCIEQVAMVFDGDYVYLYVKEAPGQHASGAGSHSNGQFVIKTDLGRELLVQLNRENTVSGVDGATCSHVGNQWEIAIPKSALPSYEESLSFGLYDAEPFVTGVANLQADEGNAGEFTGIVYDGLYGDWDAYPMTHIDYATAGTQEHVADASGALWSNGSTLYGYAQTTMPQHVDGEAGGEFTHAVTIRLNEDDSKQLYPSFFTVDENGNINWNPKLENLEDGTYEFYISSTDCWHNSTNINNLSSGDRVYGRMKVTVRDGKDEMEFEMDLEKVAERFDMDASDIKVVQAQYGRLGQQWITYAGASSGPWAGVALCCAVAGSPILYRKRKKSEVKKVEA